MINKSGANRVFFFLDFNVGLCEFPYSLSSFKLLLGTFRRSQVHVYRCLSEPAAECLLRLAKLAKEFATRLQSLFTREIFHSPRIPLDSSIMWPISERFLVVLLSIATTCPRSNSRTTIAEPPIDGTASAGDLRCRPAGLQLQVHYQCS